MKKENLKRNLIKTAGIVALTGAVLGTSGCANEEKKENEFYAKVRTELKEQGCTTPNRCAEEAVQDYLDMLEVSQGKKKNHLQKIAKEKAINAEHEHGKMKDAIRGGRPY